MRARTQARSSSGRAVGAERARERDRRAGDLQSERDLRRQIGVDQNLVARLNAVDHARPDPAGSVDGDGDPGARRVREAPDERRRSRLALEHDAVVREPPGHQTREQHVVADAADGHHVEPLDADAPQRRHARPQLVGAVSPAVATPSVTSRTRDAVPLVAGSPPAKRSARSRSEAPSAPRATIRLPTTPTPPLALPANIGTTSWSNAATVTVGCRRSCAAPPAGARPRPPRRGARARARRWCRPGPAAADPLARRALGERNDARHDQVVVAQAEAAAR